MPTELRNADAVLRVLDHHDPTPLSTAEVHYLLCEGASGAQADLSEATVRRILHRLAAHGEAINVCEAKDCTQPILAIFSDGAGKALGLCEDHGDLLAVGFPLKRSRCWAITELGRTALRKSAEGTAP